MVQRLAYSLSYLPRAFSSGVRSKVGPSLGMVSVVYFLSLWKRSLVLT